MRTREVTIVITTAGLSVATLLWAGPGMVFTGLVVALTPPLIGAWTMLNEPDGEETWDVAR